MRSPFQLSTLVMIILLSVLAFMTVYPLGMIVFGSFRSSAPGDPGFWTLAGYREAFSDPSIIKAMWTTLFIGIARTVITMITAVFICWIVVRTDTPFKGGFEFLFWIGFFLPALPMTMGWILLMDPDYGFINRLWRSLPFLQNAGPLMNIYSYAGIIWAHIGISTSIRVIMFAPAFRNMDASLEESARMSGESNIGALIKITFPLLIPAIMGATLLGFIRSMEAFEVELLLGMPAKIFVFATKVYDLLRWEPPKYPPAMALSMVFMLLVFAIVFLNRWIVGSRQYVTVSGRGFLQRPIMLGKWKWATFSFCALYLAIFTFLPMTFLVIGTFMKISGLFNVPDPWSMRHWTAVLSDPLLLPSLKNSFIIGLAAGILGSIFFSIISYISIRTKLRGKNVVEFMSWLPWAVPGILLALGLLWVFLGGIVPMKFIYGTVYILIIAQIITEIPTGTRVFSGTMIQLGKELEESSRVLGASWIRTFRSIVVPILAPTFVAVGVLTFLSALRSIQTVVLLYSGKSRTLSILMLEHYIGLSPEKGMVIGVMITFIVIVVALIARAFGLKVGMKN